MSLNLSVSSLQAFSKFVSSFLICELFILILVSVIDELKFSEFEYILIGLSLYYIVFIFRFPCLYAQSPDVNTFIPSPVFAITSLIIDKQDLAKS